MPNRLPGCSIGVDSQDAGSLWLSSVTVQELIYGVERMPSGQRRRRLHAQVLAMLDDDFAGRVVAYDGEVAAIAGMLLARAERDGRAMPLADAQIAATCLAHQATLATRNTKDFAVTGVVLVNPWE